MHIGIAARRCAAQRASGHCRLRQARGPGIDARVQRIATAARRQIMYGSFWRNTSVGVRVSKRCLRCSEAGAVVDKCRPVSDLREVFKQAVLSWTTGFGEDSLKLGNTMNQIFISHATYMKLLRVAELTQLDPEQWADTVLAQMADEFIKAADDPDAGTAAANSVVDLGRSPTEDESTGIQWWNRLDDQARRYWTDRAGNTGGALDAWETYKRERGPDDSREMT
jgi:hypothetical protein